MPESPRTIGLLFHPKKPESIALTERMEDFLRDRGRAVWIGNSLGRAGGPGEHRRDSIC